MEVISRREALALGLKRFYTGRRCKYDHDSERYVSTGNCIECAHPKIATPDMPPALEKFKLPNGRVVSILSKEDAYAKGWKVYFTGLPCSEGHMAERSVGDDRCLACAHPTKYGPDAQGWLPFSPKPPLRVPPRTPLHVWPKLVEKLQALIPSVLQEIENEGSVALPRAPETMTILGAVHRHDHQIWQGYKLWWAFPAGSREVPGLRIPIALQDYTVPWVEKDGKWFGVLADGTMQEVVVQQQFASFDPDKERFLTPKQLKKATERPDDYEVVIAEQKRIMGN